MIESNEGDPQIITNTGLYYRVSDRREGPQESGATDVSPPLVLLVHGRAGTAEVMWVFAKTAMSLKPVFIAPQAPVADELGGWSWWRVEEPDPNRSANYKASPEEIINRAHHLGDFVNAVQAAYGTDRQKTIALGFSQGGAILGTLALERPDLFSKVGMLASFIPRAILERTSSKQPLPPFFFAHGTKDQIVTLERAKNTAETLQRLGAGVQFMTDDVGHKVGSAGTRALAQWISG